MSAAHRTNVDQQPESEFQRQAKELLARRLAATTQGDRRALERELAALLASQRTRSAWDAVRDAQAVEQAPDVPRDTSRDRSCHTPVRDAVRDGKLAAAGRESE